jgi:hypothetical protein
MFRYWTDGTPEAENFSTVLVGLLSESTQGDWLAERSASRARPTIPASRRRTS